MNKPYIRIFLTHFIYKRINRVSPGYWWEDQIYNLCEYVKTNSSVNILKR